MTRNPNYRRRSFLAQLVVAGVGATALGETNQRKATEPKGSCLGSASDAIILLLDLLFEVQGEAYIEAGRGLQHASLTCANTLQILYDDLEDLLKQLKTKRIDTTHPQIRERLQHAQANVRLVTAAGPSAANVQLALASLVEANAEISEAAQGLLPPGDVVLDEEAKKILERIMEFARRTRDVPETVRQAEKDYSAQIVVIRENFQAVRSAIFDASTAAESDANAEALTKISKAIASLKKMPSNKQPSPTRKSAVETMTECLEGAIAWVNAGSRSVPIFVDGRGRIALNPLLKKHHGDMDNESHALTPDAIQGVGGLLTGLCQPNNWSRRGACYWAASMAWLRHPQDSQSRVFLIAGALTRFACDPGSAKDSLIRTLAGA